MLHPLVDPTKPRQGMMQAKSLVIQAIRRVELDPANDGLPPLVVIMAMVEEKSLFPLSQDEEVLLLLPPKDVWERQFLGRLPFHMPGSRPMRLDDALHWYEEHARWKALGLPVTLLTGALSPG
ncbi:hypothetical protein D7Y13_00960 [Corallococcus praedator]|uniref:Uncharacterized protein n=2 Tax=Myxococcaceae TaxID=31 RepID=A0ABX9QS58_9BACT|nr:hypothetical protein D7X75_05710 [Corallococcus sp. CA031C]RKI17313.1 hypothetical protein D7Y13_00960 [Corallococcus praedator]